MLLAALCWAPVLLGCDGLPEPADVRYRHEIATIRAVGSMACGELPQYGACPIYSAEAWAQTAFDWDPCLPWEPPAPGRGEVTLMRVTAVDAADNDDCGD